ncbi:hypothetical protein MHM39_14260 [Phaeobacter sp. CNT1-3]|nr:hypothetical protein [Phaeobacter sp. CNT1-3]
MRASQALFLFLLTGFGLSFLLALGERDWFHCYAHVGTDRPPLPSIWAEGELMPVILETLTPPFGHPMLFVLHFGAGIAFATYWLRHPRRPLLFAYAMFAVLSLFTLLPPSSEHGCDPTGTGGLYALTFLTLAGIILALAGAYIPKWIQRS